MLNPSQLEQIHALTKKAMHTDADGQPALYERMDAIMKPALAAAETAPIAQVEDLIGKLPLGYYRQTLRVTVIERTRPVE
jgi:hypothetical protein